MPRSLTARTFIAGLVWIAVALGVGGVVIMKVFEASAVRQFDAGLEAELDLLTAYVTRSDQSPSGGMSNPDFRRVYSGTYWQAEAQSGLFYRSRSLWDTVLPVFETNPVMARADIKGPDGQRLRMLSRTVVVPGKESWTLAVAQDRSTLKYEMIQFRRTLWIAAAIVGAILLAAAFLLLRAALRPLKQLRRAVLERQSGNTDLVSGKFPTELAPLVDDLNALLQRNERLREKGRVQAANLAHALKTPAAILSNELLKARRCEPVNFAVAEQAVENISAAADRHLSLIAAAPEDMAAPVKTDIVPLAHDVTRAIGRMYPELKFEIEASDSVILNVSRPDVMELLGNVVENAAKWAASNVQIRLIANDVCGVIEVGDDGPGVVHQERSNILKQGIRLDETTSGSGLGLTIVTDILEKYRGALRLETSPLGGLRVEMSIPSLT